MPFINGFVKKEKEKKAHHDEKNTNNIAKSNTRELGIATINAACSTFLLPPLMLDRLLIT